MRNESDLVKVRVSLYTVVDLDWERIETDPNWIHFVADKYDLSDPEQRQQALFLYIANYISRERLFAHQPVWGSNGPADLQVTTMEVIEDGSRSRVGAADGGPDGAAP